MGSQLIEKKVIEAIRSILGKSNNNIDITPETLLFQTGLDFSSIDGVLLVVKIEEIFNIKWPDELLNFSDNLMISELIEIIQEILENEGIQ